VKFSAKNQDFKIRLAIAGNWQFSDAEAVEMTKSIVEEYLKIFDQLPKSLSQIILSPFPQENPNSDRWRAETRGSTVTIVSGVLPYKSQAIQRLHEQLRHEIFHLWLPNSLALSGNYDWFYEGFTIYHALRTGVELNQIRFEDFLNTLGKAYDLSEEQTNSLVELSNKRWMGTGNVVYAKGLVVAFLCDAALLQASKGKRNLKNVFRQVYEKHQRPNQIEDGNSAITNILRGFPELKPILENYIAGRAKIDWENDLTALGIEQEKSDFGVQLKVATKLNGRQKDLLDKLGYNQWRKILQKTR
jgi:predicted metalloprotease with PDZ domain